MLLYSDGNFIQVLEGDQILIDALYNKILMDDRHSGKLKLMEGTLEKRNFPDWSMGFKSLSPEEYLEISGYKSLKNIESQISKEEHPIIAFMKSFLKINSAESRY